ncbi:TIP120-domain-containing protein [Rhizopogon vinicolor AM-OR11-026]|uniref:TIP120-domain-containing protein n=1 Tax=Rhizopogon vinicolor AM-OR11-026 TaxID=1314800 RepID=A0A1B7N6L2_9AGAM|nr:TIP120-domain-containing protein [Rhizopogon vinicolor AM-OR11-026]
MTKTYLMNSLIEKMQSPDQDFRFMGLNDLMNEIKQDPASFIGDEPTETKVLKQVLSLVEDRISEVKNQAVKCLGQLIKIIRETQMELVVDSLITFSMGKDDELRDISGLALKTITSELPLEGKIAARACAKLAPKLLQQVTNTETPPETLIETLSTLSILITRFPAHVSDPSLTPHPLPAIAPLLSHSRPAVRKRAILTLSQYVPVAPRELVNDLLQNHILPILAPSANIEKQRTTVHLVAAIIRQSPQQLASVYNDIIPGIVTAVQRDDDELREGCLQAFETLVLRSPTEAAPFLNSIVQIGNQFIKYDPNYAGLDDDEDEDMADGDEDDEDDAELDEYSDDEDTSYKIRRASTKLLAAVITTHPELLTSLYKEVSPVLISRFGDREETVRLEVWATYVALLNQTSLYGGLPQSQENDTRKRKRDSEEQMDVEETPYSLLRSQVSLLSKALLQQLKSPKTPPLTIQAGFQLLHSLLGVLPGCLSSQITPIAAISKSVLSQSPTTSTSGLHLTCLSFIALYFATHAPGTFSASLPTLTPVLLKSAGERHPRVASEAFRVFSALLNAARPVKNGDWTEHLYDQAFQRLSTHDTDAEVRGCAEDCIADLWVCALDVIKPKGGKEWQSICRTTGNTSGAVRVVTKVAKDVEMSDEWVNYCVEWIMGLLKKSERGGKPEVFIALDTLLKRYSSGIPTDLPPTLVPQVRPYVSMTDISLLSHALTILAVLLDLSPSATFPEVERELLNDIYQISHSPLVAGAALDSVLAFFSSLVQADAQIATHVVPSLALSVEKANKSDANLANVAKCIGQVVQSSQGVAAGTIAAYSKHIKSKSTTSVVVLSLLIVGELGRFIDMSKQQDTFTSTIEHFAAEEEEIRTAAAFAAGNIAIGNLHQFLPAILRVAESDPQKKLLSLHALKEVVTHCSHGQLEGVAEQLWAPLFQYSEDAEDSMRNVAAACLGKLTTTHPSRYLPQLHSRIHDENPATRATVVSAIRHTLAESAPSYDEVLAPLIMDFLDLIHDQDLNVRRLALSALNSAARTKPYLIRDHLPTLLPSLYAEMKVNPDLIRTVQMGPWTHKVDDGLDARKTAWETLYTLLDTCLTKLDLSVFLSHLLAAISDPSDEIKVIGHMLLARLSASPTTSIALAQRLDELTPALEATMRGAPVTKDTVKQDIERAAELRRSTMRAVAALSKIDSASGAPKFDVFVEESRKNEQWGAEFKELLGH